MIYLDTVGIKFLSRELNEIFKGNKIGKIVAYDKNSFSIFCGKKDLYFENKEVAIVFSKDEKLRNTEYTSSFILQLKKYIQGGLIKDIYSRPSDRIIIVDIEKMDITGDILNYRLIYELLGKEVNVLLVNEDSVIITNMFTNMNAKRKQIKNSNYVFPQSVNKYGKYMMKLEKSKQEEFERSYKALIYENNMLTYNEFLDIPYTKYDSLNDSLNAYFKTNSELSLIENKKRPLLKYINKNILRLELILNKIPIDLEKNKDYEEYKRKADILVSNLYKLKGKEEKIELFDYYNNKQIEIQLDSSLSPSKNVEKLYQKYAKCKRRQESLFKREEDIKEELEYYKEQLHYTENETDILGLEEIEKELGIQGKDKLKSTKQSKRNLHKKEYNGAIIFIGRNSTENEKITFEIAKPNDYWFHIKDVPGSHILVKSDNITDDIIQYAAKLAVENSKNKISGTVDYCMKKFIKKIPGAKKGQVIYKNYKSISV